MKLFKKCDFLIFVAIITLAVVSAFILWRPREGKKVKITVDNKLVATYSMSRDITRKIETENGTNTLVIKDGSLHFEDCDCRDKVCEGMGKISSAGESIVCLPHGVIAEVVE